MQSKTLSQPAVVMLPPCALGQRRWGAWEIVHGAQGTECELCLISIDLHGEIAPPSRPPH